MAENSLCFKCKSEKVMPKAHIMDRGDYSVDAGSLSLVVYENPEALIFKGTHEGQLYARVCGECGYTELFLENPKELYEIYQNTKNKES